MAKMSRGGSPFDYFRPVYRCGNCGMPFASFRRALDHENGCKLGELLDVREGRIAKAEKRRSYLQAL